MGAAAGEQARPSLSGRETHAQRGARCGLHTPHTGHATRQVSMTPSSSSTDDKTSLLLQSTALRHAASKHARNFPNRACGASFGSRSRHDTNGQSRHGRQGSGYAVPHCTFSIRPRAHTRSHAQSAWLALTVARHGSHSIGRHRPCCWQRPAVHSCTWALLSATPPENGGRRGVVRPVGREARPYTGGGADERAEMAARHDDHHDDGGGAMPAAARVPAAAAAVG